MLSTAFQDFERQVFSALNLRAIPMIKHGYGSPAALPTGLILLETRGRISGQRYDVPVVATSLGKYLLVGTVRGRSQWLRNLVAEGKTIAWVQGEPRQARVIGFPLSSLHRLSRHFGAGFALLELQDD